MRRHVSIAIVTGVVLTSLPASADTPQSPKREVPDYDGRGPDPSTDDGAGVWLARVLLSPLYFTSEFILRRPIGAMVKAAEGGDVLNKLWDFFAFGPHHTIGFLPVALVEFGFNPSVGVYGFWDNALVKRNELRLHYEAWPTDWLFGAITDRYHLDDARTLKLRVEGLKRPDTVFYGIGPRSLQANQSRYTLTSFDVSASIDDRYWRSSQVIGAIGVRKVDTSHGHYGSDPSLEQAAARGAFAIPYGFDRDYVAPYTSLFATIDTRKPHGRNVSGVRLEVESEQGGNVERSPASGWIRYGATGGAYVDLNDHGRVLGIKVGAMFADPLGSGAVPFTELVTLGGEKWMRGYFPGRLVDRSAAVATLSYAWPIAPKFDATLQASVGNVFGEHLEDFNPKLLRFSGALGFATLLGDPPLEFLVGFGTETIEQGAQVDSFRLSVGVPRSF